MASRRTALLLVAAAVATVGVYVAMFSLSTTDDRPDTLDVGPVPAAASSACARLRADLDALPPLAGDAPAAVRAERLLAQDRAVRLLVEQVRAVGPQALAADEPAVQWLSDWEALAQAQRTHATSGAGGPFTPPVQDGRPISDRMGRVGVPACVVPRALVVAP